MTKIKICGITNLEDALLAARLGADALGFNFYPKSLRHIESQSAAEIVEQLPAHILKVGVFVNGELSEIETIVTKCQLDVIQLHGNETQEFVNELKTRTGVKVMKVFRIGDDFDPTTLADFKADAYLLDADSSAFGGSGGVFDWNVAREIKKDLPDFYLAGGLTPENVADAIRLIGPYGVDVCSGVEAIKGKKDRVKLATFIREAKQAV